MHQFRRTIAGSTVPMILLLLAGCAARVEGTPPTGMGPAIEGLSTTHAAVGDRLVLRGSGFPEPGEGWVDAWFEGEFVPEGTTEREPVSLRIPLRPEEDGTLVWNRFGAYRVPFGRGDRVGVFSGRVRAVNRYADGTEIAQPEGTELLVRFTVDPSIVIVENRAFGEDWFADCEEPSTTVVENVFYATRALAVGFTPRRVEWTVGPGLMRGAEVMQSASSITLDALTPDQGVVTRWAPVPEHNEGYSTGITVRMTADDGSVHSLDLSLMVRRPLQTYFVTRFLEAEVYPAELIRGPILGTTAGTVMTYQESVTETRTRSVEISVANGWADVYSEQHSESRQVTDSESLGRTRGTTVQVADATTAGGFTTDTASASVTAGRTATSSFDFTQTGTDSWNRTVDVNVGRETGRTDTGEEQTGWNRGFNVTGMAEGMAGLPVVGNVKLGVGGGYEQGWTGQSTRGWADNTTDTVGIGVSDANGGSYAESLRRGGSIADSSSRTESVSRSQGTTWGRTRSYSEANSYSEQETLSRSRSYGEATARSQSISHTISQQVTERFEVSSSTTVVNGVGTVVYEGSIGAWYRQMTRRRRFGAVVAYDLCGNGTEVGAFGIDDYSWSAYPLTVQGTEWPIDTRGRVPEARCIIPPCQ